MTPQDIIFVGTTKYGRSTSFSGNPTNTDATNAYDSITNGTCYNTTNCSSSTNGPGEYVYNPPGTVFTDSLPVIGRFTGTGVTGGSLVVRGKVAVRMPAPDNIIYAHDKVAQQLIMVSGISGAVKVVRYWATAVASDNAAIDLWWRGNHVTPYSKTVEFTKGLELEIQSEKTDLASKPMADPTATVITSIKNNDVTTLVNDITSVRKEIPATVSQVSGIRNPMDDVTSVRSSMSQVSGTSTIPTVGPTVSKPVESDNTVTYVVVGVVGLALLGGGAYFIMGSSAIAANPAANAAVAKKKGGYFDVGD